MATASDTVTGYGPGALRVDRSIPLFDGKRENHIKTFSIVKCIWKECQILRFRSKNRTGVVDFEL